MLRHILLTSLSVVIVHAFTPTTLPLRVGEGLRCGTSSLRSHRSTTSMQVIQDDARALGPESAGGGCPMSWFTSLFDENEDATKPKAVPSMQQTYMQGPMTTGSHGPLSMEELTAAKQDLDAIIAKGFRAPVRSFMDDAETKWRFGEAPNYDLANLLYLKGKSKNHAEGSLEQIVEDLVKTWEMEASHKPNVDQWQTITSDWRLGANGWKMFNKEEAIAAGNYNVLAAGCAKETWDTSMNWDETHEVMHKAFAAFPWEVLEVFSGPPKVVFSWRHWAHFTGEYKGNQGKGELVEMYGMGVAEVSDELKLKTVEIYYKPEEFFAVLEGKADASEIAGGKSLVGPGCPFMK